MQETLPVIYISVLLILLAATAIFIFQQIFRVRRLESQLSRLQEKLQKENGTAQEYYELGSLYLQKKLFVQATLVLQKALKGSTKEEPENLALVYNALGFAYVSQEQYDLAIRQYKEALKLNPEYLVALNNLASAYERKKLTSQSLETYEETLKIDPNNSVAKRRVEALRKRLAS